MDFDKPLSKQTTKNDDNKEVTWLEYLHDEVLETIKSNYMYYLEAVKANDGKEPKITDEQQSDIDDTMKQYKEQAHKYGYTLSAYLVKAMGRGVTEKTFRQEAKIAYIAQNYKNDLSEKKASKTYYEDATAPTSLLCAARMPPPISTRKPIRLPVTPPSWM